jgi:polyisoprenoid-binding protein YceI
MLKHLLIATMLLSATAFAADAKKATKAAAKPAAKSEKVEIDPATSKIVYLGKKVTGEHTGEVKLQSGSLEFDAKNNFTGGEFVADMTTINNTDLKDAEYNKKLVGHLNSDDFFATEKFKTATFKTTSVKKVKGDNYTVTGDLTIKGKSNPVTFNADATKTGATAVIKFDRTKYDIKYGSGQFFQGLGDKMINDEVQLTVTLTVKK